MGAVAEHQVQEQHAALGVAGLGRDPLHPQGRVDHRVGTAPGEPVVTEVDDQVPGTGHRAGEEQVLVVRDVGHHPAQHGSGDEHALLGERASAEQAAQGRTPGARVTVLGDARRPGRYAAAGLGERPLGARGQVGPSRSEDRPPDGEVELGGQGRHLVQHLLGGGLGDDDDVLGGLVGGERTQGRLGGEPTDRSLEVATADAEAVAPLNTCHRTSKHVPPYL